MRRLSEQTVFTDVHSDACVSPITIVVGLRPGSSGIAWIEGKLWIVALVYWPDYGDIWHVVTPIPEHQYDLYREPEPKEETSTSIVWSNDCLSCLCNLPHPLEEHVKAVEEAHAALQSQIQMLERDMAGEWELDEETNGPSE